MSGPPAIAEAFAAPSTLSLRQDLTLKSPVVATVKHGERLEVLQTRRRFVQVRTPQGAVGWTDNRQLLSPDQMQEIRRFTEANISLPSQGAATAFEQLNVHTEPSRTSPSFIQIPENGTVQVIGHKLAPRTVAASDRPITAPKKKAAKRVREKEKQSRRIPPPPMPPAPKLPANWREMSRPTLADTEHGTDEAAADTAQTKPLVLEDWSLIRTKDGKVGWVLSRMLNMSIPDEVAQYAEGHRITSYFPLSNIQDGDQTKHAWLWTTMSHGGQPFEFDGFRVFTWSLRHHRYETVYRERDVRGFYPVSASETTGDKNLIATFTLVLDEDGQLVRKTYAFNGYRVNSIRQEPFASEPDVQVAGGPQTNSQAAQKAAGQPWYARFGQRVRSWFR